ncbi:MAG: flagellar biosynthesis protein FlhB [Gammaproteobacteria bacterium]|nr:flagellar biosynthesis protein FlhB [Gammaproteobacteria bacterium]MDH4313271.1 flagellar biosynthesis protein FlhB [Gammaproteobacteria bacterium]MDH5212928.1 flagellar biosynthesis protein FlhB [Gammaproteobacteria bacterium]MDH5499465.1 flagellar biosynthesis protein FlhB [Gammaproteobacteria bacterium]
MAEEQLQDRTEQATPKRLEDARKKGDVPRSRELTMTGVMLAGSSALLFMAAPMASKIVGGFSDALVIERANIFDTGYMAVALGNYAGIAMTGLVPLAIVLLIAALGSSMLIGGWAFSMSAVAFKGERMNPIKGFKRIFSANSLNELLKAMAKFGLIALIAVLWLWWSADELLTLGRQPVRVAIRQALEICGVSLLVVSCGLVFIALADVPFQLWNYQKKIRMTRQQVRDEFKETEGRPEVKSRIRMLQNQIAQRRMMAEVPGADVVITNPTHFAVALKYDEASMGAPRVIAKGKGLIAKRIRDIAAEHDVPLFSAPPLARALFRSTKLGQEIPAGLYTAVAQVLAYIFQINNSVRAGQVQPEPPTPLVDETQF